MDHKTLSLNLKPSSSRSAATATATARRVNWVKLPTEVTASILWRLGAIEILTSAEMVCKTWLTICKDPLMWRHIDMRNDADLHNMFDLDKMCRRAVDRSSGNLVDIAVEHFANDELLNYITHSSSGIRRLRLVKCYHVTDEGLSKVASRLPMLEDLEISLCTLSHEPLEVVGSACPLLKSLKLNKHRYQFSPDKCNNDAHAIAGTMQGLHHLQIFGNKLTNEGLRDILNCCPHLESLDLRHCQNIYIKGDLEIEKKLAEQIKQLRLPDDSTADYEFDVYSLDIDSPPFSDCEEYGFSSESVL